MSILSIAGLATILLLSFGTAVVSQKSLQKYALKSRLDICAVNIATQKISLYESIEASNQWMKSLQLVVYSARGMKLLIPGAAILSSISEQSALQALRTLVLQQNLLIKKSSVQENLARFCEQTKHSKEIIHCYFQPNHIGLFFRSKTVFTDVPGELKKISPLKENIFCSNLPFLQNKLKSSVELFTSAPTENKKYRYHFIE